MVVQRGYTSKDLLELIWDYPVYVSESERDRVAGRSYAQERRAALSREAAFATIAGEDPRPLLVMRECDACKGSDDALLSTRLDNEKTLLMSSWFHMVKLPNHVLEDDHPLRHLFGDSDPSHLFLATRDGSVVLELSGQQSQTELWNEMNQMLGRVYADDAEDTVQEVYKLLDRFDQLDQQETRLRQNADDALESKGPKSSKFKKLQKQLAALEAEREQLREQFDEALKLEPRAS